MNILSTVLVIFSAVLLIGLGLLSLLQDLLGRGPHDAPSTDDGLTWPSETEDPLLHPGGSTATACVDVEACPGARR